MGIDHRFDVNASTLADINPILTITHSQTGKSGDRSVLYYSTHRKSGMAMSWWPTERSHT